LDFMGVIYKLKEEVVSFILNQRQADPLSSCRQLAEAASQKFGLKLSKSSVHDVLKESGITTPRGRKPKNKFEIPQEKKKEIQSGLSQAKLLAPSETISLPPAVRTEARHLAVKKSAPAKNVQEELPKPKEVEISSEYGGAGKIFLKAALWDLGIFSEQNLKEFDWDYYLTYCKGIKVYLQDNKELFIDMFLPVERCVREAVDGLINNTRPLLFSKVSDEILFKACMEAKPGTKMIKVSIVDDEDRELFSYSGIVERARQFEIVNIVFVENKEIDMLKRAKSLFMSETIDNNTVTEIILNLRGFDTRSKDKNVITLLVSNSYTKTDILKQAVEKLNSMYLRDEQNRQVKVELLTR
jgi:hypothetical protein